MNGSRTERRRGFVAGAQIEIRTLSSIHRQNQMECAAVQDNPMAS
jgi:hypothetical protein